MKMKRFFVLAMILAAAVFLLTACGGSEEDAEGQQTEDAAEQTEDGAEPAAEDAGASGGEALESGKVSLTVRAEEGVFDNLQKMIDSFIEAHKGEADLEITLVPGTDASTKNDVLADIFNAADVFFFADDQLAVLVAAGAVAPVEEQEKVKAANLPEAVEGCSIGDKLYAYPMTADNGYFLYYDKQVLSESDVQTLDGVLAACKKAGKEFCMECTSGWYMYAFFGNTGLEFGINEDGLSNYCNWNATEGDVKGTDIVDALMELFANPAFSSCSNDDFVQKAKSGKAAAGVGGVWNAVEIQEAWGDYGAVKLPTYTVAGKQVQMSSFKGYKMAGVNYYSKHKAWAQKLADWFTNEENQTLRFEERSQGPSNIKAAASEEVQKLPAITAVVDQAQYGVLQRVGNSYWNPFTEFEAVLREGNPQKLKTQDIIDKLVAGITE